MESIQYLCQVKILSNRRVRLKIKLKEIFGKRCLEQTFLDLKYEPD